MSPEAIRPYRPRPQEAKIAFFTFAIQLPLFVLSAEPLNLMGGTA
jgi:hypothetical protein